MSKSETQKEKTMDGNNTWTIIIEWDTGTTIQHCRDEREWGDTVDMLKLFGKRFAVWFAGAGWMWY
jgi:hypothetical protein